MVPFSAELASHNFFATYTNNTQKERWEGEDGGIEMLLQRPSSGDGKWVTFATRKGYRAGLKGSSQVL